MKCEILQKIWDNRVAIAITIVIIIATIYAAMQIHFTLIDGMQNISFGNMDGVVI